MSKIIEFATEQIEIDDTKKIVVITETTDIVKNTSVEKLQQEINHLIEQITQLTNKKNALEAEKVEIITALSIS